MKTTKIVTIATIITIALITLFGIATASAETADRGEFYPKMSVVTGIDQIGDTNLFTVTVIDKDGHEWSFFDDEGEWQIGDIANLLMRNLSNEREEEDEIVEVYYEGTMDEEAMGAWLMKAWQ